MLLAYKKRLIEEREKVTLIEVVNIDYKLLTTSRSSKQKIGNK
jgi:hypothetical protein